MATSPDPRRWLSLQRTLLMAGLWLALAAALLAVREVLLPFAVALLLAYVLHPAVSAISSRSWRGHHLPRWVSTILLYVLMGTGLWAAGSIFVPQISAEVAGVARTTRTSLGEVDDRLAGAPERLNALMLEWDVPVVFAWPPAGQVATRPPASDPGDVVIDLRAEVESVTKRLQDGLLALLGTLAERAQGFVGSLVGFIFRMFLVLMLTAFMLSDVTRIRKAAKMLVPAEKHESFDHLVDRMDEGLAGVVRGQLTICLVNGVLTLAGLLLLKVKFAFLLSATAACMSLIPIFGSIASSVPIVAVALTDSLQKALLALGWIIGIHLLEANLLNPKIMGSAARIHPLLVVLALVAGEHFYGFTGALFAVPCLSVVLTMFKFIHARALRMQETLTAPEGAPPGPAPSSTDAG